MNSVPKSLAEPEFDQPILLEVTGVDRLRLQNWVSRGHLILSEQHPGRGRSRLYSRIDACKVAVLRWLGDFGIGIERAGVLADALGDHLRKKGALPWDDFVVIYADSLGPKQSAIRTVAGVSPLAAFGLHGSDANDWPIAAATEGKFRGTGNRRRDASGNIVPERREKLARRGIHAEPALIFPIGEIVNATLLRLREAAGE